MRAFAGSAGGAVALLVPLLLAVAGEPAPAPPEAAARLDINLTDQLAPGPEDSQQVLVLAPTLFGEPGRASDPHGLNRAVVTPVDLGACDGVEPRDLRLPGPVAENCLAVTGLGVGSTSTAVLRSATASQVVALTVDLQTRHHLVWPLLAVLVSLAAGVALTVFQRVRPVRSVAAKLKQLSATVAGAPDWLVASALHLGDDAQVAILEKVRKDGPPIAEQHRAKLEEVLADGTPRVGAERPLRRVAAAAVEATAKDREPNVWDFFAADGEPVTHPLAAMTAGLVDVDEALGRTADLLALVRAETGIAARADLETKLTRVRSQLEAADRWDEVARLVMAVDAIELEILKAGVAAPAPSRGLAAAARAAAPASGVASLGTVTVKRLAGAVTIAIAIVAAVAAVAAVLATTWAADPDFGTLGDYLTVLAAGFGAGSSGSVTALIADRLA